MSDEQQPRPRYGEYAPGYVPGQQPAATPESTPPPAPPSPAPWTAGPQGGQPNAGYAEPRFAQPGQPGVGYQAPVKKRNTVDLVFTIILLVLGLIGTLVAVGYAALFRDPQLLDEAMRSQGRDGFDGSVGSAPLILIASHLVLFLAAIGLSILSLVKKRITFWIPLSIGVVAAVIFWATVITVLLSDPSFSQQP